MTKYPKKLSTLSINETEDGYVIYDRKKKNLHFLNNTAVFVLELCTGENTLDHIAEMMQEAFKLEETPLNEVSDIVKDFIEQGLIK